MNYHSEEKEKQWKTMAYNLRKRQKKQEKKWITDPGSDNDGKEDFILIKKWFFFYLSSLQILNASSRLSSSSKFKT